MKNILQRRGQKLELKRGCFFDLKEETVKDRIDQKPSFKTLSGIKSMYICKEDGQVLWRKLPCFCKNCGNLEWDNCTSVEVVGKCRVVIKAGVDF